MGGAEPQPATEGRADEPTGVVRGGIWRRHGAAAPGTAADPPKSARSRSTRPKDHDPDGIGKFYMGREIAQVMGYQGGELAGAAGAGEGGGARRSCIEALDVKPGMVVADVGAGSGYHTFRLAPLVGEKGKVIASDIQPEMLEADRRTKAKKRR